MRSGRSSTRHDGHLPEAVEFDDAATILDTVATWISENLDQLPAGAC
jgi:hypothetical protein